MVEVEICVADAGGVAAAAAGGADRVELCSALELGGLTPSLGALELAHQQKAGLFVTVLIRPRAGDFVYDQAEADLMVREISALRRWADGLAWASMGFTVGALLPDGTVDAELIARLVDAAAGRPVVFHKAFDTVPQPATAIEVLGRLGVEAVLTSGGGGPCLKNLAQLRVLASSAQLTVAAAGGVRPGNVAEIAASGVPRVHLRAPAKLPALSAVTSEYDQAFREITDVMVVAQTVAGLGNPGAVS